MRPLQNFITEKVADEEEKGEEEAAKQVEEPAAELHHGSDSGGDRWQRDGGSE